ncbi:MAG: acyl-ACP--UDP-N-acetylglucosamine O-acyltransferase [Planctomycetaceae bacterium]|nr:acyl-ACP--UDP-N-acetylglucosamine O-acyltransferase [Planctomycetaceae bacterium]
MPTTISPLAHVDPQAVIGADVTIGPFCLVGPNVVIGDGSRLDSHVTITGNTTIGRRNRFWPNAVIGAEPQDKSYVDGRTGVVIGDDNQFREGVTVNRGAEKEDGITRIGDRNLLMSNAHVAHNCRVFNDTILVNGVLLGGHVHVQDRAIISGNSAVHHFTTVGRLAFVGGCSKVVRDVPPFMLSNGCDKHEISTINLVGLQRAGVGKEGIALVKQAYRVLFRENKRAADARAQFLSELNGALTPELSELFDFLETQSRGRMGRAREVVREQKFCPPQLKAA